MASPRRNRRSSREAALQVLYASDLTGHDVHQAHLLQSSLQDEEEVLRPDDFAAALIAAVDRRREDIDEALLDALKGWALHRVAPPDRAVLRLGVAQLLAMPDIPPRVVINESIELARKYGDTESPKFVNGVLDAVYRDLKSKGAVVAERD